MFVCNGRLVYFCQKARDGRKLTFPHRLAKCTSGLTFSTPIIPASALLLFM